MKIRSASWWLPSFMAIAIGFTQVDNSASAQEASVYIVGKTKIPPNIDGKLDESSWKNAERVGNFVFPWWKEGKQEQTQAMLLWDDQCLYAAFRCEDAHIAGDQTQRDSKVYQDDCVEIFTAPNPAQPENYFNIEMNVRGAFLDQHHPDGPGKPVPKEWNGTDIRIATSVIGSLNDDRDEDQEWILEVAIPFHNFSSVAVHSPPNVDDVWHLNLNRLGGKVNPQFSQWRPSKTPRPSFHVPLDFGKIRFANSGNGNRRGE